MNGITADASVAQGNDLHFSYQIKNIAAGLPSAFSNAAYYIDQKPDPNQFAGFNLINPLAAGAVSPTLNDTFNTAGLSVGQHTLWIAADNWNQAGDGNPLNNFLSINFTVAPPLRPDLRVSSLTVPINTMQGLDFNFSYSVQNIGTAASAFSNAAYYFDQMPDPTHHAGFDLINPLTTSAPQTSKRRATTSTPQACPGPTPLYVAADNSTGRRQQPGQQRHFDQLQRDGAGQAGPDREQHHRPGVGGAGQQFQLLLRGQEHRRRRAVGLQQRRVLYRPADAREFHYPGFNLVNQLPAGTVQGLNGTFDTSFLTVGSHTLWVAADNWNQGR